MNGWLPVTVSTLDFTFEFNASDVPSNPVELLGYALIQLLKGIHSEVSWHLEPNHYLFRFDFTETEYQLTIEYQDYRQQSKELLHDIRGDFNQLILPFYRAIKSFLSHEYKEPHWPELDQPLVNRLNALIKESKLARRNP